MNALISLHFPAYPFFERGGTTAVIGCRWQLCSTRDNEFQWGRREKRTSQSSLSAATYFFVFQRGIWNGGVCTPDDREFLQPTHFFFFFRFFLSSLPLPTSSISWMDIVPFSHTREHCDTFSPLFLLLLLFDSVPAWHSTSSSQHDTSPTSVTSPILENRWERRSNQEQLIRERKRLTYFKNLFQVFFNEHKQKKDDDDDEPAQRDQHPPKNRLPVSEGSLVFCLKKKEKKKTKQRQKDKLQTDETLIINTLKNLRNANENKSLNKESGHLIKSSSFQGLPDIHTVSVEEVYT